MDSAILIDAIEKAIRGGAVAAPREDSFGEDVSYVRTQTDVAIEASVFEAYIAELKADADMAAFDGAFANVPSGGGVSVGLASIARLILARAIATNDVVGTVNEFVAFVADNAARAVAVLAVSGVKVIDNIALGPDISLIPLTALLPSPQRGTALGQNPLSPMGPRFVASGAFITSFVYQPVFYWPENPQPPEKMAAHVAVTEARYRLFEAFDLLGVLGIYPTYKMSWVQSADWLRSSSGITGSWQYSSTEERLGPVIEVEKEKAEELGANYFSIDLKKRNKTLRIPLDRLGRAGRELDFEDRAIDLGIALESLLLHDIGDHGELSFRLSLRGAWLIGANDKERLEVQRTLKKLYDLRSQAVHNGFIERNEKNRQKE